MAHKLPYLAATYPNPRGKIEELAAIAKSSFGMIACTRQWLVDRRYRDGLFITELIE